MKTLEKSIIFLLGLCLLACSIGTQTSAAGGSSVTPTPTFLAGTLSLSVPASVGVGQPNSGEITLNDSSGVSNLNVILSSTNSAAVVVIPASCTLSSDAPLCYFGIISFQAGSSNILLDAVGYPESAAMVSSS